MHVRTLPPCAQLAPYVQAFQFVETSDEVTRALFPDPGLVIGFRYGGSAALLEGGRAHRLPDWTIAGLRETGRRIRTAAGGGLVVAKFRERGAAAFLDVPLHELFGAMLPLEAVLPGEAVERTASRIAEAGTDVERVARFEELLLSRLRPRAPDRAVRAAVAALETGGGRVRVGELAQRLGLGLDALEKRFRRVVGASPKQFARILRLRRAVDAHLRGATLSSVPYVAGYHDQSHFIREFRAVTGQPPRRFFAAGEHC